VRTSLAELAVDVRIEMTRTDDRNLGLAERARVAAEAKAKVFLSIHFNASNGDARGVETWIRPKDAGNVNIEDDRRFADGVARAVHGALLEFDPGAKNRGVKESARRPPWLPSRIVISPVALVAPLARGQALA
jgi:N-acetylmuramoyl-L-alanine amidase